MFLRRSILLFVLVSLLLKYFENGFIILQYNVNKSYIASVLCENKDLPAMRCFGKCQLSKRLREAEEKEEHSKSLLEKFSTPVPAILGQQVTVFFPSFKPDYWVIKDQGLKRVFLSTPIIPPDPSATPEVIYS